MLSDNISRLCKERGISIFKLEGDTKIGNGTIGKWRLHGQTPRVDNVKKIADYFGVTVDELLRDTNDGGDEDAE